jgi:hypothetical protein
MCNNGGNFPMFSLSRQWYEEVSNHRSVTKSHEGLRPDCLQKLWEEAP